MVTASLDRRAVIATIALASTGAACRGDATERTAPTRRARADLYHCEGCEGALERDPGKLSWQSRIGPGSEPGEPMRIEGRVLKIDGKTPAAGVIVYAYQTNAKGLYANGSPETEWSRRHGRLRGWAKTDAQGRYAFETTKPAPYPTQIMPAHVHLTVIEPGRKSYYIDDIVFDGEFGVTPSYRARRELRGGSGIVSLTRDASGRWMARRNIVLERHP